jgi:hypothetical protein
MTAVSYWNNSAFVSGFSGSASVLLWKYETFTTAEVSIALRVLSEL